jgi:hypothetical protein
LKKLKAELPAFVGASNTAVRENAQVIARQLSGGSQLLAQKLSAMQAAANSIGMRMQPVQPLRGEQTQYDEDKLMRPINDPLSFIGQFVTPALPDMRSLQYTPAMTGGDTMGRIMSELNKINNMKTTCAAQRIREAVESVNSVNAQNCANAPQCTNQLASLTQTISDLSGKPGLMPGQVASFQSGISMTCDPTSIPAPPTREMYTTKDSAGKESFNEAAYFSQLSNYQQGSRPSNCAQYVGTMMNAVKNIQIYTGPQYNSTSVGVGR